MSAKRTIAVLLTGASEAADADRSRQARRGAREVWVAKKMAQIRKAHHDVDNAWDRYLEEMEAEGVEADETEDPPFPEQEALDALFAQAHAVRDHDRWPKELYWGGI